MAKEIAKKRIQKAMENYVAEQGIDQRIPKSQRGIMLNHAKYARVDGMNSVGRIEGYLKREKEKLERNKKQENNQGKRAALEYLEKMICLDMFEKLGLDKDAKICDNSVAELFTKEELQAYQMELLERVITFENRRGKGNMV